MRYQERNPFEGLCGDRRSARFERGPGGAGEGRRPHRARRSRGPERGPRAKSRASVRGFGGGPGFGPGPWASAAVIAAADAAGRAAGDGAGPSAATSAPRSCWCSPRSRCTATRSCRRSPTAPAVRGGRAPARSTRRSPSSRTRAWSPCPGGEWPQAGHPHRRGPDPARRAHRPAGRSVRRLQRRAERPGSAGRDARTRWAPPARSAPAATQTQREEAAKVLGPGQALALPDPRR